MLRKCSSVIFTRMPRWRAIRSMDSMRWALASSYSPDLACSTSQNELLIHART